MSLERIQGFGNGPMIVSFPDNVLSPKITKKAFESFLRFETAHPGKITIERIKSLPSDLIIINRHLFFHVYTLYRSNSIEDFILRIWP